MPPSGGGAFLWEDLPSADVFLPDDLTAEDRAIGETTRTFIETRVLANMSVLEAHDLPLLGQLVKEAGDLGLLAVEVPTEYGGGGLGRVSATHVVEGMGPSGGFAVTQAAHSGLAMLPIALFGTPAQKARYLPLLASGTWVAGYALTEPGFGSDALRGRTAARPAPDGGYLLTGEKQWITNSGIASLWVVFAQLEGQGFSAFLVERDTPGVKTGGEYGKLGIRSSSTRPLILEDVHVPAANLLGTPGRGAEIALSILDISRLNLGAGAVGSGKSLLRMATRFAQERSQFGRPIADFGMIREKLARMQVRLWALETAVYRTAGLVDRAVDEGRVAGEAQAAAEYALECAIVKVLGSEVLDFVVDEALQIHGGYGYMTEYPVERAYRDARINRIFEGTNEINRLTIPETLLRRAARGRIPWQEIRRRVGEEIAAFHRPPFFDIPLARDRFAVHAAKLAFWQAAAAALERTGWSPDALAGEEEMMASLADMAIAVYSAEGALLRAERRLHPEGPEVSDTGEPSDRLPEVMARLTVIEALAQIRCAGERVLTHAVDGDAGLIQLSLLRRLTARDPFDEISDLRTVAAAVLANGGFLA